jgi:hypothetical protein
LFDGLGEEVFMLCVFFSTSPQQAEQEKGARLARMQREKEQRAKHKGLI